MRRAFTFTGAVLLVLAGCARSGRHGVSSRPTGADTGSVRFAIDLDAAAAASGASGTLYVMLCSDPEAEPFFAADTPDPVFKTAVAELEPGQTVIVGADAAGYPCSATTVPSGRYSARVLLDRAKGHRQGTLAPGNLYSSRFAVDVPAGGRVDTAVRLEHVVRETEFGSSELLQEITLESELLRRTGADEVTIRAAIVLPASYYDKPERCFPTVYVIPGWGSTHHAVTWGDGQRQRYGMDRPGLEKVFVFLNNEHSAGYHCFADSAGFGRWGSALVQEFIPFIEGHFRVMRQPRSRFLAGQSSGAWGCLWLKVSFPNEFASVWAASPDPVDFRAFGHDLDIYADGANVYLSSNGGPRPARRRRSDADARVSTRAAVEREMFIGEGGQIGSFETLFSQLDGNGEPMRLFDRVTGLVDPRVAAQWARYDLSRVVATQWSRWGSVLERDLHIVVADDDDYFLDEPVELFRQRLEALGARVDVRVLATGGHDVWTASVRDAMHGDIENVVKELIRPSTLP